MALTSQIEIRHHSTLTGTAGLATPTDDLTYHKNYQWTSGTGASQSDKRFRGSYTISASSTQTLDLAGSLTDPFGATITFAKIKKVEIYAASGNTNDVNVIRPASNGVLLFLAAGDGIPVKPGGALVWVAPGTGVTVTAGTGDLLDLTNSAGGTSVDVDVIIEGTSA